MVLKKDMTHRIMLKEEEKGHCLQEKNKKSNWLEERQENLQQLHQKYTYKVQKDDQGIKDSEFIKAKEVKNSASKGLTFKDFDKCVHDITNAPITHTTKNKLQKH